MLNIGSFIFYNFILILIASIIYFFSKESIRVAGGKISMVGLTILIIFLGIFIIIVSINWTMYPVKPINNDDGKIVLQVFLSPYMIYLIIFSVMLDKRVFFPLVFVFLLTELTKGNQWNNLGHLTTEEIISIFLQSFLFCFIGLLISLPLKKWFFKNDIFKTIFVSVIFLVLNVLIYFFEIYYSTNYSNNKSMYSIFVWAGYISLIFLIQIFIIYFIERAYKNFNKLETFSVRDDISYYKMSLAKNELRNIIDEQFIEMGILLLFDIKTQDKDIKSKCLKNIRKLINNDYENVFYFKATSNYYGTFIPFKSNIDLNVIFEGNKLKQRVENDPLFNLDKIIEKTEKLFNVNIFMSGSLYGIHSYDIEELIEYCKFLFTPLILRKNISRIIIYDFKRVQNELKERSSIKNLPIDTSDINISFLKVASKENIYYPLIEFKNMISNQKETIKEIIELPINEINVEEKEMILRYSSYQTLRKFNKKDSSLIIYYSEKYLSDKKFDIDNFIKKITRYIQVDKIIVGLFISKKNNSKLINNINKLKELGIRFALINTIDYFSEETKWFKPDFIINIEKHSLPFQTNKDFFNLKLIEQV